MATDIDSVAGEWEQLAERVDAVPFARPGWVVPWLRAFGTGTPEVLTVRREGELVGVLPLERSRGRLHSAANWHSPLFPVLALDGDAHHELMEALFRERPTRVELDLLNADEGLPRQAEHYARGARRLVVRRMVAACPVIDVVGSFEDYEGRLSRNRRKSLRRGQRLLEAEGTVSFEIDAGLEALDEVLRVEASGWKGRRGTAITSQPHTRRFYTEVAEWAADRGWLRLALLRLDGRAIACDYSIEFGGACYSLKSGYDEEYGRFGPGALLLREQLRGCFERGATRMELLGTEDPFKLSFSDRSSRRARVEAFRRNPAGLVGWSLAAARRRLRANSRLDLSIGPAVATWASGLEVLPLAV